MAISPSPLIIYESELTLNKYFDIFSPLVCSLESRRRAMAMNVEVLLHSFLPTWSSAGILLCYLGYLALVGAILPGKNVHGAILPDGTRLHYRCNGLASLFMLIALLWMGISMKFISPTEGEEELASDRDGKRRQNPSRASKHQRRRRLTVARRRNRLAMTSVSRAGGIGRERAASASQSSREGSVGPNHKEKRRFRSLGVEIFATGSGSKTS
ncbi:hypothetical protein KSP40_PGU008928 [Platanthera guangdongensis]|uniref:Uncharacterized protein n=1 Tax=Platanthera guangdongensis TaxID=2320717 RepID=A0ABR2MTX0_9ASPA